MKSGLLITAAGLVLLGVVGYFLIPTLFIKSEIEHLHPQFWRIKLHKSDGYFNTGIKLNDQIGITIHTVNTNAALNLGEKSPTSWIAKINDVPNRGNGWQFLMTCIREKRGDLEQCVYVPENYRGNLYVKNDSFSDVITIYVELSSLKVPVILNN